MELFERRAYNTWSWLRMDQQHPPWYWNSCYTSSLPPNPTLSLDWSREYHVSFLHQFTDKQFSFPYLSYLLKIFHKLELQTEAAKPVLGKCYREPKKSWPFPFHLFGILIRSMKQDHYVSDSGDVVYYQKDPLLYGTSKSDWSPEVV